MLNRRLLRTKVIKALYAHLQNEGQPTLKGEGLLKSMIQSSYDLYIQLLLIPECLQAYAQERLEIKKNKYFPTEEDKNPNTRFADNQVIKLIDEDENLHKLAQKRGLGWNNNPELIKSIYDSIVLQPYFQEYMSAPKTSFKQDQKLVADIFMNSLEEHAMLEEILDDQSTLWNDDLGLMLVAAARTVTAIKKDEPELVLADMYKSEEDQQFAFTLFSTAAEHYAEYQKMIENATSNWDLERIAMMDRVILTTAIAEAVAFESIPLKVTMNEYIEIAKYYSTLSSSTFINGILDKLLSQMEKDGKIVKSGLGLMEK